MDSTINFTLMAINLTGGLALFLYGMHRMTDALKILAGERVKFLLARLTSNRFSAALAGAGVTAVIQSSSITTVLVVGFISAGVMNFQQSIGVILGANVGTTITAQIIAFKVTKAALFLIAIGFFTETLSRRPRLRYSGAMFMGLGMLFFGMELMTQATAPLRDYEPFMTLMRELQNPLLGVLIGAVFTALVQSSSATTGIVIVMASQGLISLEVGIALVLGSNIGTCVTAWISSLGKPREAIQASVAHILFNVSGVVLFVGVIPYFADLVRSLSPVAVGLDGVERLAAETPRQIANAHTLFNVFNLVLFLGFTNSLARLVLRIVPPLPADAVGEAEPRYLDRMYLSTPAMAFDRVRLELIRVSDKVLAMLRDSFPCLLVGTRERIEALRDDDREVRALTDATVMYLRQLATADLVNPQPVYLQQYLGFANYLEKIADVVETGLMEDARKRLDRNLTLTKSSEDKLRELYKAVYLAAQTTFAALAENDTVKAAEVLAAKKHINGLLERARSHFYVQFRSSRPDQLQEYKLESNTLENLRRIHLMLRSICKLIQASRTAVQGTDAEVSATVGERAPSPEPGVAPVEPGAEQAPPPG
jgi:phosphate:Na+ symporter